MTNLQSSKQVSTDCRGIKWPKCPLRIPILNRKGHQFILVTENDRIEYDDPSDPKARARTLAVNVCNKMLDWLLSKPAGSFIDEHHWEHEAYGDAFAMEYSIFMHFIPLYATIPSGKVSLMEREVAFFALEEFRAMLGTYGAMQGEFEMWAYGQKRSITKVYVQEWPHPPRGATTD